MTTHLRKSLLGTMFTVLTILLATTTSWGQTATITITPTSAGGTANLGNNNYGGGAERTWDQNDIDFGAKYITIANQAPNAGAMQGQANNGLLYNISALPGKIINITVTGWAGNSAVSTLYVGDEAGGRLVEVTAGAGYTPAGISQGTGNPGDWTIDSGDYRFFAIKRGASASYWSQVEITYETASPSEDPTLFANPLTISGLNYPFGSGPSAAQSFALSGENLDGSAIDLLADDDFEISFDEENDFEDELTLPAYDGSETTIWVRLKSGRTVGSYNGIVLIDGGGIEEPVEVAVSGAVLAVPVITPPGAPLEGTVGVAFTLYQIDATDAPASYAIIDGSLPDGLDLDTDTGEITGTPAEAGSFSIEVTATNAAGTSVPAEIEFDIAKGTQTIADWEAAIDKYDGDAPFDLPATTEQGLTITYDSSNTDVATVDGNTITIVGLGTATITAINAGDDDYEPLDEETLLTVTEAVDEEVIYSTGFEAAEGFTAGTNYQITVESGPTGAQWYTYYGTPTTTAPISGSQSMQMRLYNDGNIGYTYTNFDLANVTRVTFKARWNSSAVGVSVAYSTDGGDTWGGEQTFELANTAEDYEYSVNKTGESENVRIRFTLVGIPPGSGNKQLIIDDVVVYGVIPSDATLYATPTIIENLNYAGAGPSTAQTFALSGTNIESGQLVSITIPEDFEISLNGEDYFDTTPLEISDYDGTSTDIYVRLKAGLDPDDYSGQIMISGGGAAENVTVNVSGTVSEPFTLPYFNGLRNETDWNQATTDGFLFNNTTFQTGGNGYVRFESVGSSITSPEIDFSAYNVIIVEFSPATFGTINSPVLSVQVSNDNGGNYTTFQTYSPTNSTHTNESLLIDLSSLNGAQGRIKFELTSGSQIRFRDLNMEEYEGFLYSNSTWFPSDPNDDANPDDNILIANGTASFDDIEVNNITVNAGATLNILGILKANGNIVNEGNFIFKSTSVANTAQLDEFTGTITGNITVERFIPGHRAFRFLSSAVTSSSIRDSWQEGVNNPNTSTNLNPNPGFGTHITGSTTGANGFDATTSGAASMFTINNAAQAWETVANTNVNPLAAGKAYRLLVRGSREVDLNDNDAVADNTVLRATGTMATGTVTDNTFSAVADEFNFFGNPYQAQVDMNAVIAASTNINSEFYYVWDPNLGVRGAYAAVELPEGIPTAGNSNQYLQPGQAALIRTLANGAASITFQESHKAVNEEFTTVFNVVSKIDMQLYEAAAFANGNTAADGLRIKFTEDGNNAVTSSDATKFGNLDENLATLTDGSYLSIENRAIPTEGDIIQLFLNQYRHTDYVFQINVANLEDIEAYLRDAYTGEETLLPNDETSTIAFEIDSTIPESVDANRFDIYFAEPMSVNDHFGAGFALFPNPSSGEFFITTKQLQGHDVTISLVNMFGQDVYNQTHKVGANGQIHVQAKTLSSGIYIINLKNQSGESFITRWIKN